MHNSHSYIGLAWEARPHHSFELCFSNLSNFTFRMKRYPWTGCPTPVLPPLFCQNLFLWIETVLPSPVHLPAQVLVRPTPARRLHSVPVQVLQVPARSTLQLKLKKSLLLLPSILQQQQFNYYVLK